jgi:hypothetical protein
VYCAVALFFHLNRCKKIIVNSKSVYVWPQYDVGIFPTVYEKVCLKKVKKSHVRGEAVRYVASGRGEAVHCVAIGCTTVSGLPLGSYCLTSPLCSLTAVRLFCGYEAKLVGVASLFTPHLNLLLRLRSRSIKHKNIGKFRICNDLYIISGRDFMLS